MNESADQIWTHLNTPVAVVGDVRVVLEQMVDYIKKNNLKPPRAGRNGSPTARKYKREDWKFGRQKHKSIKIMHRFITDILPKKFGMCVKASIRG